MSPWSYPSPPYFPFGKIEGRGFSGPLDKSHNLVSSNIHPQIKTVLAAVVGIHPRPNFGQGILPEEW